MRKPKNPTDPRYIKNHQKIISTLNQVLIDHASLSNRPADVYRRAGLGRSTFFDHFKNLDHVFLSGRRLLRSRFRHALVTKTKTTTDPKDILTLIVTFTLQNRDFFRASARRNDFRFFTDMLQLCQPYLSKHWRLFHDPSLNRHIYALYSSGLEITFHTWAETDFHPDQSEDTIHAFVRFSHSFEQCFSSMVALAQSQMPTSKKSLNKPDSVPAK